MLVFGVITILPGNANAYYDYYPSPFGSYDSYQYGYNSVYTSPIIVQQPVYTAQPVYVTQPVVVQQPIVQYQSLNATCSASAVYNQNYYTASVTWTVNPTGGNGYYNYSWSGTDGLSGSSRSVYYNYSTYGLKYASVNVYSNGQSINVNCSPVNINQPIYQTAYQPIYQSSLATNRDLDIGCFADPVNATVNQPVNWSAEVTGGVAPYTYSWSGSDSLSGNQSSVVKYYSNSGSKNAIVTVTSADGRTGVKACSNALAIADPYKASLAKTVKAVDEVAVTKTPTTPVSTNANSLTAASLFSLNNVPWGWVAVLIILVLFFTVMYLLFNRKKI